MSRLLTGGAGLVFSALAFALAYFYGEEMTTGQGLFIIFCIAGGMLPMCYYISNGDESCD
jgi:hypothetical protein